LVFKAAHQPFVGQVIENKLQAFKIAKFVYIAPTKKFGSCYTSLRRGVPPYLVF